MKSRILALMVMSVLACGQSQDNGSNEGNAAISKDPRCATLCENEDVGPNGYSITCDNASVSSCVSQCEAKVAGLSNTCGLCLLEKATFGGGRADATDPCDISNQCSETKNGITCKYTANDAASYKNCLAMWYPNHTRKCVVEFENTITMCGAFCI